MIVNEEMAASIIPMHVLIGCHHNSGFYGVGKKLIADPLQSFQEAHSLLEACGSQLPVPQKVLRDLEQFVIQYVYSGGKNTTLADVKAAKWRTKPQLHFPVTQIVSVLIWSMQTILHNCKNNMSSKINLHL